jgi:hypothetical protein
LFARAHSVGKSSLPRPGRTKDREVLLGQLLDLSRLPALGILDHEGNLVLYGAAQITGPVMLWRGKVRKATGNNGRLTGTTGYAAPVWDSLSAAWKLAVADFGRADAWIKAQQSLLNGGDLSLDSDYDSGLVRDIRLPDTALLLDTNLTDARIMAREVLRVGSGAHLSHCKLLSRRVFIEGNARMAGSLAFASKTLNILGGDIEGGQFLAVDSVRITSDRPLKGYPVFYAQGRMANRGKPDSTFVGSLDLEKATGDGVFISACKDHQSNDQDIRLSVGHGSHVSGLVYTACFVRMEGRLEGSLICHNLKFESNGTLWVGHLKDARIDAMSGRKVIPVPLVFPGFSPVAFAESVP